MVTLRCPLRAASLVILLAAASIAQAQDKRPTTAQITGDAALTKANDAASSFRKNEAKETVAALVQEALDLADKAEKEIVDEDKKAIYFLEMARARAHEVLGFLAGKANDKKKSGAEFTKVIEHLKKADKCAVYAAEWYFSNHNLTEIGMAVVLNYLRLVFLDPNTDPEKRIAAVRIELEVIRKRDYPANPDQAESISDVAFKIMDTLAGKDPALADGLCAAMAPVVERSLGGKAHAFENHYLKARFTLARAELGPHLKPPRPGPEQIKLYKLAVAEFDLAEPDVPKGAKKLELVWLRSSATYTLWELLRKQPEPDAKELGALARRGIADLVALVKGMKSVPLMGLLRLVVLCVSVGDLATAESALVRAEKLAPKDERVIRLRKLLDEKKEKKR
jgi:hypothetical protein